MSKVAVAKCPKWLLLNGHLLLAKIFEKDYSLKEMKKYYISDGTNNFGPLTLKDIMDQISSGNISLDYDVWDDSSQQWASIVNHPDFFDNSPFSNQSRIEKPKQHVPIGLASDGLEKAAKKLFPDNLQIENILTPSQIPFNHEVRLKPLVPKEEDPKPIQTHWHIAEGAKSKGPFTFFEVLLMLQEGSLNEYDLIQNTRDFLWKKVAEQPDFEPAAIKNFKQVLDDDKINRVFYRRAFKRLKYTNPILIFYNGNLQKVQCTDISQKGIGIYCSNSSLDEFNPIYINFTDKLTDKKFDALADVVSVSSHFIHDKQFFRYGLFFKTLSIKGKDYLVKTLQQL